MIVLDTSILIEIERKNTHILSKLEELRKQNADSVAITAPTYSEYLRGFIKKKPTQKENAIRDLAHYLLLNTTRSSCIRCAELSGELEKAGTTITDMDIVIASIVLEQNGTIITQDKHFKYIPNFKVILM